METGGRQMGQFCEDPPSGRCWRGVLRSGTWFAVFGAILLCSGSPFSTHRKGRGGGWDDAVRRPRAVAPLG